MKRINKELANIRNKFKGKFAYLRNRTFKSNLLSVRYELISSEDGTCSVSISYFFLFSSGDKQLDGYQKKKYVCKLLFIFLLGHDIDFGHMEAVNLLSSNKYTEKQIVSIPKQYGSAP